MFKFFKREQLNQDITHEIAQIDGMTIVDAYYIQDDQVELYKQDRERYSDALIYILSQYFSDVDRMFEGSDDGEAIVAFQNGEPKKCIYLNPETIDQLRIYEQEMPLKQAILKICDLENNY
ncbi:hypothetical protein MUA77_02800 [Mammaliicoccus sciuri]|uniref:hypothetical protein n=1 Tax=Mammaliicoccus sciuri TaxID=1296 RepID=UPI0021D0E826|nr:hypothetical protein [Mammaliicoccus sciuri]UXU84371.1 hypothetical protein MUA77_02800 [Mammaliicoccus sciuri]UXU94220.1 hypothetical protein MUA42_02810 [Mammaliicoccus sciuri]UXV16167.1 hypothetical protein MUA89_02805 [Mammaliicoccus sciuri]UXV24430.1 hypothetical protein MUA49_02805 [Mammaliicoccus sciuri]UXV27212.1 hypothetical protein MUA96_02805 [Mammaliicoccus sciuri]